MSDLNRHRGQGSWIKAVGGGVLAFCLTLCLLTAALYYFLPDIADGTSKYSVLFEIAVVFVSLVVGISQVVRYR